jgi:recombination protein RecR
VLAGLDLNLVGGAGDLLPVALRERGEERDLGKLVRDHARILSSGLGRHNGAVFGPSVDNLVAQLSRLPGVGTRTAQRLAFHLLQVPKDEASALARSIDEVKERVRFCRDCGNLTEEELCGICADARRDHSVVCVVEQPVDLVSLERTHEFRGLYHVLGGALSPLDGVEPEHLRIDELLRRVDANGVQEVVLATNPNMTGEATAAYLADRLRGRVRVTRLASGLPVGGDLEYADEVTLGRALAGRREM